VGFFLTLFSFNVILWYDQNFGVFMLECLIVGDSIAVGTQQFRQECALVGKGGINTWQFNKNYAQKIQPAETVIISLGSNDHDGVNSFKELLAMRQRVEGKRVFWILPAIKPHIQDVVQIIAKNFGDTVLPITRLQPDKVHPSWAGYKELAEKSK
jgi:lysophospholipase L1-like esterase